jgi:hypothetical protein
MYRHMYDPMDGSKEEKHGTVNITIQNCIYSEALDYWNHSFGSTTGGENSLLMHVTFGLIIPAVTHQWVGMVFTTL